MGWKNRFCISIIILFVILFHCQAENNSSINQSLNKSEFYDYLIDNSNVKVTGNNDIRYNKNEWNPTKNWQKKGSTKAWIDIVGYKGLIKYNETFYINSPHTEAAYILYDAKHSLASKYSFNSLNKRITNCSYDGNAVIAVLSTKLKYHWTRTSCHVNLEGKKKCKKITTRYKKENNFTGFDHDLPEMYPSIITIKNITATVYNNSLYPKTIIELPQINYTLGYRLEFDNECVEYYHDILEIEYLDNDFPYGNVTKAESNSIYQDSDLFSRIGNNIIINSTEINNSLNLYIITPYHEHEINYNVVNKTDELKFENKHIISLFNISVILFFIVFLVNYFRIR